MSRVSKGKLKFLKRIYKTIMILNKQRDTGEVDLFEVASLYQPIRKRRKYKTSLGPLVSGMAQSGYYEGQRRN